MSIRFMHQSLLAASMITPGSAPVGVITSVVPQAAGSADLYAQGSYTGDDDLLYIIEIDSVSAGTEVGAATYRWQTSADSAWVASGQTTSASLTTLSNGVQIRFASGTGNDFALGDNWTFQTTRRHGRAKLLDSSPDTEWRSTGVSDETLTIDLGAATLVQALCIGWHNLTSGATITLMANSSNSWGSPPYNQALTWASPHIGFYPGQTYRYWRLRLQDAANPDGYLRLANLYLGGYFAPARDVSLGLEFRRVANVQEQMASGNVVGRSVFGRAENLRLPFSSVTAADLPNFESLFAAAHNLDQALPLWVCVNHVAPSTNLFYGLLGPEMPRRPRTGGTSPIYSLELSLAELPRTKR